MTKTEYLLTCLAEECAEVAQRASKAVRFGVMEIQPGQPYTNKERLADEINDLETIVEMLKDHGVNLWVPHAEGRRNQKKAKVHQFMVYSKEMGVLE